MVIWISVIGTPHPQDMKRMNFKTPPKTRIIYLHQRLNYKLMDLSFYFHVFLIYGFRKEDSYYNFF